MEIKESTEYESCIGVKTNDNMPQTLSDFFDGEEEEEFIQEDWKKHWIGMPDFKQENNPPFKRIQMSFRTSEDYDEYAKLIDQNLTMKTKSIWYPKLDRDENTLKRWLED